ncbi:hypothetical protein Ddc_00794 [Ditylenchus destructor]|nr:hypothetical protein Ddc_00794 [Ditylenchus destructor]
MSGLGFVTVGSLSKHSKVLWLAIWWVLELGLMGRGDRRAEKATGELKVSRSSPCHVDLATYSKIVLAPIPSKLPYRSCIIRPQYYSSRLFGSIVVAEWECKADSGSPTPKEHPACCGREARPQPQAGGLDCAGRFAEWRNARAQQAGSSELCVRQPSVLPFA